MREPRTVLRQMGGDKAMSLVELLIIIGILVTLAAIALPLFQQAVTNARNTRAIGDIRAIEGDLLQHYFQFRAWPTTLDEIGHGERRDPWGYPYQYLNFSLAKGKADMRKDRFLVPLNSDYDLYSNGQDGDSQPPLPAPPSHDDIIRANDGSFVGLANLY